MARLAAIALTLLVGGHAAGLAAPNPIRKVVSLMQDMQKEVESEMAKEKALFEKFMCICTEYPAMLADTIDSGKKTIEKLNGQLEEEKAVKEQLAQDLTGHKSDKEAAEADLGKASNLREKETAENEAAIASGKANVNVLGKMIPAIEKGRGAFLEGTEAVGIPKVQALLEADASISEEEKSQTMAFLSGTSEETTTGSGEVVGILKQMLDDMTRNLADTEKNEQIATVSFGDLKGAKDEEIGIAADAIQSKEKRSGELAVSISHASDSLEDTQDEKADAEEMLHTLSTQCGSKKKEWDVRMKLRAEEVAAISEAIKVLNDDDALDTFKKALPSALVQAKAGFMQARDAATRVENLEKVEEILRKAMGAHPDTKASLLLSSLSSKLRVAQKSNSKEGPDMSEVVKMVENMIEIVKKEQVDDVKKKEWCEVEFGKAEKEEKSKQETLDNTLAGLSEAEDNVAGLSEDMKAMQGRIASLDKSVAEATEQRKKEHGEYVEATQMSEVAIKLIGKAKAKLAKVYGNKEKKGEEEASLLQVQLTHVHKHRHGKKDMPDELPALEGPPELKKRDTSIMGLMDRLVVEMEADSKEATHEEKTAQTDYVELMAESAKTRKQYTKSLTEQQKTDAQLKRTIITLKEKKEITATELTNAHNLLQDVHQTCDQVVEHFKERSESRDTELEGLNAAVSALK